MNSILALRDLFRSAYSKHGNIIKPICKIILAFIILAVIQKRIGYSTILSKPAIICAASVLTAFFPFGFISFLAAFFVVVNMFEASVMMASFALVIGLLIFVLYYGYRPGMGIVIALVPLMFFLKLPFLVPLILGLTAGIYAAIPAAIGVVSWNIVHYFAQNAEMLSKGGSTEIADEIVNVARTILIDEYMYALIFAFVACVAVVHLISRSSMNHCWTLSIFTGTGIMAAVLVLAGMYFESGTLVMDIVSLLISFVIALLYVQVFYGVDFSRTEHLSFEDDDYYYYVKAVPKLKANGEED